MPSYTCRQCGENYYTDNSWVYCGRDNDDKLCVYLCSADCRMELLESILTDIVEVAGLDDRFSDDATKIISHIVNLGEFDAYP